MISTRKAIALTGGWAVLSCLLAVQGCVADSPADGQCPVASAAMAIVGGGSAEVLLALSPAEIGALVYLRGDLDGAPAACSGVLVGREWVLTAAHCEALVDDPAHELRDGDGAFAQALERVVHPSLDLMLLRISSAPPGARPLPWALPGDDSAPPGAFVELAGFGTDLAGRAERLRFVVAEVTSQSEMLTEVDGVAESGACDGDSGGPLLARLATGAVGVLGVLSNGSQSCTGVDRYTRTAAAETWLRTHVSAPARVEGCGALDTEGGCFGGRAVFCDAGQLVVQDCSAPLACGFDSDERGYRCVDPARDACGGVDALGLCEDTFTAARCERGVRVTETCDVCGSGCVRASATGRAGCAL